MGLSKVDMIIRELCRITGEPEYRNYDAFIGPIRRGFVQLNIAAVQVVKTEYLSINNYNAISWPDSCIKPLIISVIKNGCPITLSIDDTILPPNKELCKNDCKTISEADAMIDLLAFIEQEPYWSFGNGEFYGLGNGFNHIGYVNHDKSTRSSFIKSTSLSQEDEFAFTFLSDGISDGLEYIPTEIEPAIMAYALHEYYRVKQPTLSAREWDNFTTQATFLRKTYQAGTLEDWREALTWNQKSSPK